MGSEVIHKFIQGDIALMGTRRETLNFVKEIFDDLDEAC